MITIGMVLILIGIFVVLPKKIRVYIESFEESLNQLGGGPILAHLTVDPISSKIPSSLLAKVIDLIIILVGVEMILLANYLYA